MSRLRTIFFGILFGILFFFSYRFFFPESTVFQDCEFSRESTLQDVKRVGINLGKWTPWGAAQYSTNVLFNPGFESGISRAVVTVDDIEGNAIAQIYSPNHYLNHFWDGAGFEILSGESLGSKGVIQSNERKNEGMVYVLDSVFSLKKGDSLVLTQIDTGSTPINWWVSDKIRHLVVVDPKEFRPGSPGTQSVKLVSDPIERPSLSFYLDTLTERGGKMLPIDGEWRLSFWAKGSDIQSKLIVEFSRIDKTEKESTQFILQKIETTNEWKEYSFSFKGLDQKANGPLLLKFEAIGSAGSIWLDDVSLAAVTDSSSPFRKALVEALKSLRPGIIRNWQGQLGDTFSNSIAKNFARKPTRYKMAYGDLEYDFFYGLDDFFDLCSEVGALPWVVIPPAYTTEDLTTFSNFLRDKAQRSRFSSIYLEFGNEVWNPLYETGQMKNSYERAAYAFNLIQSILGSSTNVIPVINAPLEGFPLSVEAKSPFKAISISPFFFSRMEEEMSDDEILKELFKPYDLNVSNWAKDVKKRNLQLLIAETNLHTLGGNATSLERNRVVTSLAAGLSLANHLLQALQEGIRASAVFKLAGFDFVNTKGSQGLKDSDVRLFGVVRDLGSTHRMRPQGLVIEALNQAIMGNFHPIISQNSTLRGGAFISDRKISIAVSSSSNEPQHIKIKIPKNMDLPSRMMTLKAGSLFDSNEDREEVFLIEEKAPKIKGLEYSLTIPPYGLLILN